MVLLFHVPGGNERFKDESLVFDGDVGGWHGDAADEGAVLRTRHVPLTGLPQRLILDGDRRRDGVQEVKVVHRHLGNTTVQTTSITTDLFFFIFLVMSMRE